MPQSYDAGAVFLAQAVLEDGDIEAFKAATRLNPAQLARTRRTMEAAHRLRRIPAGDHYYLADARAHGRCNMARAIVVDDERLHYLWNRFREHAFVVVNALAQQPDGLLAAHRLTAAFQSRECRALLRQFRAQYDRRLDGSDTAAAQLRRAILCYVDSRLDPPRCRPFLLALFCT
jgi:hypothetical protein